MFTFFGLVATVGTTYVAVEKITGLSAVMGCAAGSVICALLVVNNLRDIPTDTVAGKRTLAVRLGDGPDPLALQRADRGVVRAHRHRRAGVAAGGPAGAGGDPARRGAGAPDPRRRAAAGN